MRLRIFITVLLAVVGTTVVAQSAPGTLLDVTLVGTRELSEIEEMATPMFDAYGVPDLSFAVDLYRITYQSSDFDGSPATVGANLFVPQVRSGGALPLLVFGSGTTGISDHCAPSREEPSIRRWGHYEANMLAYASNGIVAVFPDYLGFNDPDRPQRYFSKDAEAHVMLDAVRAARAFFDRRITQASLSEYVFLGGYSQGGHAAFSAADKQPEYAPDVEIDGVVSYGGTMNVETLLREGPYYAPYIVYTYSRMYEEINPEELFLDRWVETLDEDVERMCVDQFQVYFPFDGTQLYSLAFYRALQAGRLAEEYPVLKAALDQNIAGLSGHGVPSLVIQGDDDIIITTAEQTAYVEQLCESGSPSQYLVLEGVRHRFTRAAGFRATLQWIDGVMAGEPATNCGR